MLHDKINSLAGEVVPECTGGYRRRVGASYCRPNVQWAMRHHPDLVSLSRGRKRKSVIQSFQEGLQKTHTDTYIPTYT